MINDKIYINTDGGSRGNPGPAAIGIVFYDGLLAPIHTYKETIGEATNNEAEYSAIVKALEILTKSKWYGENNIEGKEVICRLDSQLVVEQINGRFKIKEPRLLAFVSRIAELKKDFKLELSFVHIPREENKIADKLVNEALDEAKK